MYYILPLHNKNNPIWSEINYTVIKLLTLSFTTKNEIEEE